MLTIERREFRLTVEQARAVEWGEGPLMVLAGAGTGKTTVVVERVRHLLATDSTLQPENVLVLTYNVRAAAELQTRLEEALGLETASRLWVHNFHSFGNRLLGEHGAELGLQDQPIVLDSIGQRLLLRELRPRFAHFVYYRTALDSAWTYSRFAELIARAKDELVTPEAYAAFARARREAFDFRYGADAYDEALEDIRRREAEGRLRGIRETRSALANGDDAAGRAAHREARREATGGGYASAWSQLNAEQQLLARGLRDTFVRDAEAYDVLRLTEEAEAYALYQLELRKRGALDFGEQQLRTIQLLMERPNILRRHQNQFRHVLVDEFQDANMAQILLLELIGRGPDKADNVVVVGDDDQSIYRFRGASYAAFSEFERRFGTPPVWAPDRAATRPGRLPLLQNRRSTANILAAATRLIRHNEGRLKPEPLQPTLPDGDAVDVVICTDEADEADVVVARIRELQERRPEPRRWSDIAVLYRRHRHRELIVDRLRRAGIPYVVVGGTGLFSVPEVRDVEAALRVAANPQDSVAFVRLLSAGPWRLDATEILRLTRAADWDGRPVFQAAADILRDGTIQVPVVEAPSAGIRPRGEGAVQHAIDSTAGAPESAAHLTLWNADDLPGHDASDQPETVRERRSREARTRWRTEQLDTRLRIKLQVLFSALDELVPRARRDGPFAVLEDYLVRTNLLHDLIAVETPDSQRSVLALARLMRFVAEWQRANPTDSLADFIAYLDVYQQVGGDLDTDLPGRIEVEGVQLMTVYQAKGLEYEIVVVPRLVEGQFPDLREESQIIPVELLRQTPPSEFAIAEERRLAFVAMTRARRHLLMTAVAASNGKPVSRFIDEVAPLAADGTPASGVEFVRRTSTQAAEVDSGGLLADQVASETTKELLKLMPVPQAHERRFAVRRRAVELIGALEMLSPEDVDARAMLTGELVSVAEEAAGLSDDARRNGLDPLTLTVLSRHSRAGQTLLELAPLPGTFSHSQLSTYLECPLRYAFEKVYRIPIGGMKGYFEFGGTIHQAFETYARARRDAAAAGEPLPGYDALKGAFDSVWQPTNYADRQAAEHYRTRSEPALRRFYDREVANLAQAVDFEVGFTLELGAGDGESPVRFYGVIDRIDRHPDGSIEITDYKTGRPKSQADVDADQQLSAYALALAEGAVRDPVTGERLPPASRLTLYFTETDQAITTTRSAVQLEEFRELVIDVARRVRGGDFAATPSSKACGRCDYRVVCPSRWGEVPA